MKFKSKTGWVFEELEKEKKTECLDANSFGGENPEDVEKEREEKDKEINKRFEGTRKNADKVVGDDHEEHAKTHKVEEHYVGRKDLGEAIGKLKEQNIAYTVKRSQKEGFRYVVEYLSDKPMKEEIPLFEKIDLEEDETQEGFISGAEELSHDELASLEKELWDKLNAVEIHPEDGTFSNSSNRLADVDLTIVIDGDWKHDHLATERVVEDFLKEKGYVIVKHTEEELGDSDQDSYKAEHKWYLIKDTDGKMGDTVNALHHIFTPADESLNEAEKDHEEVGRIELCIMDKDNNNIECCDDFNDAVKFAKEHGGTRILRVMYGPKDEHGDEPELGTECIWNINEDLPDAIPEEPIVISTEPTGDDVATVVEEPSEEVVKAGLYTALSSELRDTLSDIENLKSLTVTLVEEGREDLIDDLNSIIDDRTVHSGILQGLMAKVDGKVEAEETKVDIDDEDDKTEEEVFVGESLEEGASYNGMAYYEYPKDSGCHVRETPSSFVATDEHGTTLGDSKTKAGAESFIDDHLKSKKESLNEGRRDNKSFHIKVKNGLYIGDLCYALDNKVYYGVWKDANYEDGAYTDPETGLEFAMVGTAWGDGNYEGSDGRDYPVDAGIIGICDKGLVAKDINDGGRIVDDVTGDVQISYEDGTIHVMWADGDVDIETDPEDDYDEYEDDEDDEDDESEEETDEALKESTHEMSKKAKENVKKWWEDVKAWNNEHEKPFDIIGDDYDDIEGWHAAMFDMLDDIEKHLDKEDDSTLRKLFVKGKRLYNNHALSQYK